MTALTQEESVCYLQALDLYNKKDLHGAFTALEVFLTQRNMSFATKEFDVAYFELLVRFNFAKKEKLPETFKKCVKLIDEIKQHHSLPEHNLCSLHILKGECYHFLGDMKQASVAYAHAIFLDKNQLQKIIWFKQLTVLMELGEFEQAKVLAEQTALWPEFEIPTRIVLLDVAHALKDESLALEQFASLDKFFDLLTEGQRYSITNKAVTKLKLYSLGKQYALKSSVDGVSEEMAPLLATCYLQDNEFQEAINTLLPYIDNISLEQSYSWHILLEECYRSLGQEAEADEHLEQVEMIKSLFNTESLAS